MFDKLNYSLGNMNTLESLHIAQIDVYRIGFGVLRRAETRRVLLQISIK